MHKRTIYRQAALLCLTAALALAAALGAFGLPPASASASAAEPSGDGAGALQAAFIRGGDLWIKTGERERRLTYGEQAHRPSWSADGQWIAYTSGERSIRLYHPATDRRIEIGNGDNYQWSPAASLLAFQDGSMLQVTDPNRAAEQKFQTASPGVGNFSWLPDGKGFLVSTQSQLLPSGWSDISLYEVPFEYGQDTPRGKLLLTFPSESKSFFAVQTSRFQWSADGKWVSFIGVPTASLSADSDTLLVLRWHGKRLLPAGEMLNRDDWVDWSPRGDTLAFIAGGGRDAASNKKLTTKRPPFRKQTQLTPQGFADRDPVWTDAGRMVVSRIAESSGGGGAPQPGAPQPFLARVDVPQATSAAITAPEGAFGDYGPAYIPAAGRLGWVRTDRIAASAWIGAPDGSGAREWIAAIDVAPEYYGQFRWNETIDWYGSRR
ncbi:PD40 domain-containing protein [Paenibacillus flagellatus]|uniref:Translocation protein TolB n=1 Tax=Paenibacillus flagellatus TaxID=2211139 RepID=A0A2V5K1L2_9BACL|nr:PD40 domain-containing protein [Paenibacillus flagellatus]PYI53125.1 hypothetical protein DLM86_19240 [Paenibacillus flagellatus]